LEIYERLGLAEIGGTGNENTNGSATGRNKPKTQVD
jgi:hypothetical protein